MTTRALSGLMAEMLSVRRSSLNGLSGVATGEMAALWYPVGKLGLPFWIANAWMNLANASAASPWDDVLGASRRPPSS